jgi:hypothetical protein
VAIDDYTYWSPTPKPQKKSGVKRILAVAVILMILLASGAFAILQFGPGSINADPVTVAILDSGIDLDFSLQGRVVAEESFVKTSYGYDRTDLTTTDSRPDDVPHGTLIARLVADTPNTRIINAKVLGDDGSAYTPAIVDAIIWSVEQGAKVVSMSLGASPNFGDPLEEVSEWAFERGVVLVASAGNEGDYGILGTTINSPSVFEHVISVGALRSSGAPEYFTSRGPTVDRYMKPDISADGWVSDGVGNTYLGTSFSAPRVAAAAAELIGICTANNITYSPGAITAALLRGATPLPNYPEYVVGAGKLNVASSRELILSNSEENELPALSFVYPGSLPVEYERIFEGDSYEFYVRLVTAGYTTFDIDVTSDTPSVFDVPAQVTLNQTTLLPIRLSIPDPGPAEVEATITFASMDYGSTEIEFSFDVYEPVKRVAFDISHSSWDIDSIFGQFREVYIELTENSISVTEIRNRSLLSLSYLQTFDAVAVLDPCSWGINETNPYQLTAYSIPFTAAETQAYEDYYNSGGGIFVVAMSNDSVNVDEVNSFLSWTGFTIGEDRFPSGETPDEVTNLDTHPITTGVSAYHHLGAAITIPMDGGTLARYGPFEVLGYKEGSGRLVVAGTNYFIDNYALLGEYGSGDDAVLALNIFLWLTGLIS